MKTGEVMTTGAASVRPEASLAEAANILIEHRISGLPVVDRDGKLIGMITEHDFLRRENGERPRWLDVLLRDPSARITARELHERRVADAMSKDLFAVGVEAPVEEVMELMDRHRVKRIPVVSDGKVVGIVSRANLLQAVLRRSDRDRSR
jgi:CBS domain-containing protein